MVNGTTTVWDRARCVKLGRRRPWMPSSTTSTIALLALRTSHETSNAAFQPMTDLLRLGAIEQEDS